VNLQPKFTPSEIEEARSLIREPSGNGAGVLPKNSDEALALEFAGKHAGSLRYVATWNKWLRWDGVRWQSDDTLAVFDLVRELCRQVAAGCSSKEAKAIASAKTVSAVAGLVRSDRRLAATGDQWDTDPWLLNTPGGVIDLRTGECRPAKPEDYMTKLTGVSPDWQCPILHGSDFSIV
jgi:putative DNA primase/helicase